MACECSSLLVLLRGVRGVAGGLRARARASARGGARWRCCADMPIVFAEEIAATTPEPDAFGRVAALAARLA